MGAFTTSAWLMDKTGASADGGMVVAKQEEAALAGARALAEPLGLATSRDNPAAPGAAPAAPHG